MICDAKTLEMDMELLLHDIHDDTRRFQNGILFDG